MALPKKKVGVTSLIKYAVLAVTFSLGTIIPFGAVLAQSACHSPLGGYCFQFATVYPGIEFLDDISDISGVFLALFKWGLIFAALSAFAVITFGGIEYVTAGDNQGRATDARRRIVNAIGGLALALVSWLILTTINPDLVKGWTVSMPKLELQKGAGG